MPLRFVVAFLYKKYLVKIIVRAKKQCGTALASHTCTLIFQFGFAFKLIFPVHFIPYVCIRLRLLFNSILPFHTTHPPTNFFHLRHLLPIHHNGC